MKMWSTREVLSQYGKGIQEVECDYWGDQNYVIEHFSGKFGKVGVDYHETREAAVAYANKMRDLRIKSLRNQLARLEALTFEEKGS